MDAKEAILILERYRRGESTPNELQLVQEWYQQLEDTSDWDWKDSEKEVIGQLMEEQLLKQIRTDKNEKDGGTKVRKLIKRMAVAASIILVLGVSSYFLFFDKSGTPAEVVQTTTQANDVKAPESNRAMITLADGRTVDLDSVTSGMLAQQGNVKLVKLADGQIAYQNVNEDASTSLSMTYNTLSNPRGSKVINMTLADGSRVWLNAGSSVTYPVAFLINERKVSITGEAYFEIAHDANKPFFVSKGEMQVQVLGTHFNVNAYDNEADIKVTLLEGSIKVSKAQQPNGSTTLKPGQQALVASGITVNNNVDVSVVVAWKNGLTMFKGADIKTIMRQVERWYDVEVVYEGNIPSRTFSGGVSREAKLSELLRILELSKVHFRIEGRKLIVMP